MPAFLYLEFQLLLITVVWTKYGSRHKIFTYHTLWLQCSLFFVRILFLLFFFNNDKYIHIFKKLNLYSLKKNFKMFLGIKMCFKVTRKRLCLEIFSEPPRCSVGLGSPFVCDVQVCSCSLPSLVNSAGTTPFFSFIEELVLDSFS